jgi:5-methyltetrahydrofolate--homocysteine methyltransferase
MVHVAREMERQGMKLPLLIGGATTSRAHTAVKIAPHYSEPVVHVLDASRAVPVTTSLLSEEGKPEFVAQHRRNMKRCARRTRRRRRAVVPLETARARRTPIEWRAEDLATPAFTGVRVLDDFPLATLREFIDWSPFFHTWELKGVYPRILEDEKQGAGAADFCGGSMRCWTGSCEREAADGAGVYGFFAANAVGDDVELYTDGERAKVLDAGAFPAAAIGPGGE